MKGTLSIGSVLVLLAILLFTVHTPAVAPPTRIGGTRVAVFNLTAVIKSYTKFKTFQAELKAAVDPFQARDTAWKKEGERLAKEAQSPDTTPQRKEELEEQLKDLQRRIEDNKARASKALQKRQGEQLAELYSDVERAARRLAKDRGYDLILHYNDATDDADRRSEANVTRKMQAGALIPIFAGPGVDISEDVAAALNDRARALEASAPAARTEAVASAAESADDE
jgi:Skp family chaperone for outer membrane proteins